MYKAMVINMQHIICPKCGEPFLKKESSLLCTNSHCFDISKEGYVNLLSGSKQGSLIGDNKAMALARKDFLSKGYYEPLAKALTQSICDLKIDSPIIADICCGEGYYSSYIANNISAQIYGFDISKEMIRLAAKRKSKACYFVSNMTNLPLEDDCVDFAMHLFAPFCENEFYRVLKPGGLLISVSPGASHLISFKKAIYDKAYENEENTPQPEKLVFLEQKRILTTIKLESKEDILSLFKMTPYYYHSSSESFERLESLSSLQTELDFILNIFKK